MNTRQRKRTIGLAALLLTASGVGLLAWGWLTSVQVVVPDPRIEPVTTGGAEMPTGEGDAASADSDRPSLDELTQLAGMNLRQPLQKPTPSQKEEREDDVAEKPDPGTPLALRLIGTIIEPGHSMAMFENSRDRSIELCPEGESVEHGEGKVTVTSVDPQKVTVRYAGRSRVLKTPQSGKGGVP